MLETRMPPISTRTRRPDAPPRPAARSASAARSVPREAAAVPGRSVVGNTALETVSVHPVVRPASASRQSRLGRSEMRLMGLATTCTAIVCGLLLLYLAAYAHVSQLGYDQAVTCTRLRQDQLKNESLRAERDRLQSRHLVIQEAVALGMTPRGTTPISYINALASQNGQSGREARWKMQNNQTEDARMAMDREQGIDGGKATDRDQQPSFDH